MTSLIEITYKDLSKCTGGTSGIVIPNYDPQYGIQINLAAMQVSYIEKAELPEPPEDL